MRGLITFFVAGIASRQAVADPDTVAVRSDSFEYASGGPVSIDGGLVVGRPSALPTGLSTGIGAGVARGTAFAWGARAAWVTSTESTMTWTVTNSDLRLRATAEVRHLAGRGTIGLRLAAGATLVHETRVRNHGARAGLTGDDLATSVWAMLPAADLDAVVAVHVLGRWSVVLSGGPSIALDDGTARLGFASQLGVAWQP